MFKNNKFNHKKMIHPGSVSMMNRSKIRDVYSGYVKVLIPSSPKHTSFHGILCLNYSNVVIPHSNSFLVDKCFVDAGAQNVQNYMNSCGDNIFERINETYETIVKSEPQTPVEPIMYLLANPFSGRNIGHDISILLDRIHNYRTCRYKVPVVLPQCVYECPRSLELCKMLLPTTEFYFLETDRVYHFKNLIVPLSHELFNIMKHTYLIEELKEKARSELSDTLEKYSGKKIFLVKNSSHKIVAQTNNMYVCPKTIEYLETKRGYVCINPEILCMNEIICYMAGCTKLIASYSGILYGNGIFVNPDAEKFILNRDASDYFTIGSPFKVVYSRNNIDENINGLLVQINEPLIEQ